MSSAMVPIEPAAIMAREAAERMLNEAEVAELRPFAKVIWDIRQIAIDDKDAAFEIAATVIDGIALADSVEAVFEANEAGPKGAEEFLENSIGVISVRFWKSAERYRAGTLGYYVVMEVVKFSGETDLISVGASNVVASMFQLMRLGAITGDPDKPLWVKIHGRETGAGTLYTVLKGDVPPF